LSPSSARLIQFPPLHSNISFTPTRNSSQWFLTYRSMSTQPLHEQRFSPIRATCRTYLIHRNNIWQYKSRSSPVCSFLQSAVPLSPSAPCTLTSLACHLPPCVGPRCTATWGP
jgi:hypothetical protein